MSSYGKLFRSIVTSSVWSTADHVRLVWVTMIALADRDGIVEASIPGLAHEARVTIENAEDALRVLLGPDQYSRTKVLGGRRLVTVDGGWRLVTFEKHRRMGSAEEAKRKTAERVARHRKVHGRRDRKKKGNGVDPKGNAGNPIVSPSPSVSPSPGVGGNGAHTPTPAPVVDVSLWEAFQVAKGGGSYQQFAHEVDRCLAAGVTKEAILTFIATHPGMDVFDLGRGLIPRAKPAEAAKKKATATGPDPCRVDRNCTICKGSGYEETTVDDRGETHKAMMPCRCRAKAQGKTEAP